MPWGISQGFLFEPRSYLALVFGMLVAAGMRIVC
jgi:hypothetical protein